LIDEEGEELPMQTMTSQNSQAGEKRRAQMRAIVESYFAAIANHDFSAVPFAENVVLRSPLAPPNQEIPYENYPLEGKEAVLAWFRGLYPALGPTKLLAVYFNEDLSVVAARADLTITSPKGTLRVLDSFRITEAGEIVEQENHYDPRPALATNG
jgi:hypothetical protein